MAGEILARFGALRGGGRDTTTHGSRLLDEGLGQFLGGFMPTAMDGDRHKLSRNPLGPAFAPSATAQWQAAMKQVVPPRQRDPACQSPLDHGVCYTFSTAT